MVFRDSHGLQMATISVVVVLCVSFRPLRKLWMPEVHGTCLPLPTVYGVAYVQSAFTIVIDVLMTAAPILLLWNVRIQRCRKTFTCFLMSLGLIATFSNALRNHFQHGLTTKDSTNDMTGVTVVAILELSSGIIAACAPTCVPFFRKSRVSAEQSSGQSYSMNRSKPPGGSKTHTSLQSKALAALDDEQDLLQLHPSSTACAETSSLKSSVSWTLKQGKDRVKNYPSASH